MEALNEILESIARETLIELDSDCMTAVRRDLSGVKHLTNVLADRAPKGRGVTFGMCEKISRKLLLGK